MIIYVDVLVTINFLINFLLLAFSMRLAGVRYKSLRLILAAALGGAFSLVIFLPPLPGVVNALIKLFSSCALVLAAGGFNSFASYIKILLSLLFTSFLLSGLMLFITMLPGGDRAYYYNGVCYFRVSAVMVLGCSVLSWVALSLWERWFKRSVIRGSRFLVTVTTEVGSVTVNAVLDSQNLLTDIFSGRPVAVCPPGMIEGVLPDEVKKAYSELLNGGIPTIQGGVRLIPCGTVTGCGMLAAFLPKSLLIEDESGEKSYKNVYIALSKELERGGAMLLSPAMLGEKTTRNESGDDRVCMH